MLLTGLECSLTGVTWRQTSQTFEEGGGCQNKGNHLGLSLEACKMICEIEMTAGCNALNWRGGSNPDCVLRECSTSNPTPTGDASNYDGYHIVTDSGQQTDIGCGMARR
jgi:hypothetical protein